MAKRILIADDSLTIQKAFAMTFAGEDVTLLSARSVDEGLTLARQGRPDLVIADVVMPGRSGYELCSAIKSDASLRGVPVYMLSSSQNPYDEGRAKQSGADGQFTKPFDSVSLLEQVKDAFSKGAVAVAPVVGARPAAVSPLSPNSTQIGIGRSGLTSVPAGAPTPLQSNADDDYGEISIEDSGPQREGSSYPAPGSYGRSPLVSEVTPAPVASMVGTGSATAAGPTLAPMMTPGGSPRSATPSPSSTAAAAGHGPSSSLRPSLIPGLRPGAAPTPARPGTTAPGRPLAAPGFTAVPGPGAQARIPTPNQTPAIRSPYPQAPAQGSSPPVPARTLVGLPATVAQPQGRFGAPAAPVRPPTQPVRPLDSRTPPPVLTRPVPQSVPAMVAPAPAPAPVPAQPPAPLFPTSPVAASAVASKIDQKLAAISARGPEYEAIAKLSREIIEKVVWEVVPELAELIIREELQKRGRL